MYNPIISHLCLQLTEKGTIVNCYICNTDDLQPKQFLGRNINDLLPSTVVREFLEAIDQVIKTQNLTTWRYSLAESNQSDPPVAPPSKGGDRSNQKFIPLASPFLRVTGGGSEQFYEVKLFPGMGYDPETQQNLALENQVLAFISNITEQEQELRQLRQDYQNLATCLNDRTYALRLANEQLWETMSELQEVQTILENQNQEVKMSACADRVGMWELNLSENTMYIDPILKTLLGYSDQEISNDWDEWQAKIHPDDIDRLKTALSDYTLGIHSEFELEYRMFHKDQSIRWFLSRGTAVKRKNSNFNHLIGTNTDITETKILEEALLDSQEWFRSIFNQAAIGIAQVDLNGKYLQVNQKLCDILGYNPDQLLGESFIKLLYKEDQETGNHYLKSLVDEKIPSYSLEQRYLRSNRQLVWTDITASLVRDSASKAKYLIVVVQDISDRRKAEFALEYSESRYRAIVEDQTELVCRFFIDGTLTFVNQAYCDYFGQSYAQLIGNRYLTLLSDEERQIHQKTLRELSPDSPVKTIEYSLIHSNGQIYWHQWNIRGFFNQEGSLLECQGVGRDISDRVQAEAERDRFFSLSLDLLCIASFDGYFKRINPAWTTTLGYNQTELLAQPLLDFVAPEDHAATIAEMQKLQQGIPSNYFENRYLCRNGSYKWIAWSIVPFPEEGLLYGVGRDITEQKQIEIQIKASLEEKEVLLKEIHHRVKNNLQIVCSLLELQSQCSQDPNVIAMFKESQQRIRSMSLVHETIYKSNDLSNLNLSQYLKEISVNLCSSYGYSHRTIQLSSNPNKIYINLDTAIQSGLILNELLTNAFKYAFSDKKSARIDLILQATNDDRYLMIVADNGIGLPKEFDIDNTQTLGWRVIRALTRKLKGEIEIVSERGTKIFLRFSKINQKSAQTVDPME